MLKECRGVEQWQLVWLITTRSQVRVLSPLPKQVPSERRAFVLVTKLEFETATLKRSQVKSAIRHFARQSTLENLFFKDVAAGPQDVGESLSADRQAVPATKKIAIVPGRGGI